jgi:hypothetical protein
MNQKKKKWGMAAFTVVAATTLMGFTPTAKTNVGRVAEKINPHQRHVYTGAAKNPVNMMILFTPQIVNPPLTDAVILQTLDKICVSTGETGQANNGAAARRQAAKMNSL